MAKIVTDALMHQTAICTGSRLLKALPYIRITLLKRETKIVLYGFQKTRAQH
jgi:hypothetical protein